MIEINKGIPIPDKKTARKGRPYKYPWLDLEIGDSFFVEVSKGCSVSEEGYMYRIVAAQKKKDGRKYTIRKAEGGLRIWRVSDEG